VTLNTFGDIKPRSKNVAARIGRQRAKKRLPDIDIDPGETGLSSFQPKTRTKTAGFFRDFFSGPKLKSKAGKKMQKEQEERKKGTVKKKVKKKNAFIFGGKHMDEVDQIERESSGHGKKPKVKK